MRPVRPHPSRGGSEGYDIHQRTDILSLFNLNLNHGVASRRSIRRWLDRGVRRKLKTGGPEAKNFKGVDALLLALFRIAYPKVSSFLMSNRSPFFSFLN